MTILYILLFLFTLPDSIDIESNTNEQLEHYANNIDSGDNYVSNLWALTELVSLNCKYLEQAKASIESFEFLPKITCENYNDHEISKLVLDYWPEDIKQTLHKITEEYSLITENELDFGANPFLHYQVLFGRMASYQDGYLEEAIDVWIQKANNASGRKNIEFGILLSNIIAAAFTIDRYEIVNRFAESFLNHTRFPNSINKLRVYGAIDYSYYIYGGYDQSLSLQRKHSLPLAEFLGEREQVTNIKTRQGAYLFALGKYEESKNIYEELYADSASFENQHSLFTNLGVNYLKLGQANKYISFQLRALDEDIENYKSKLQIYRNLFVYYVSIKDENSALDYIDKARIVAKENADTTELALIDSYLGTYYWSALKDHDKALTHLNSAEQVLNSEQNYSRYKNLLVEKGQILINIDSLETAENIFNRVKELSLSTSSTPDYVDALVNLTEIHLKRGELDQAASNLEEIKLYSLNDLDFQLLTKYYTVKANYLSASGDKRAAITELEPVLDQVIDRAKNNTDSQQGYWSVEDEYLDAFELLVGLYINNDQPEKALLLLDQLKTINDAALYNSPLVKAAKLSEGELAEEKRLNEKLQSLRKRYLNATEDERFTIKTEIDRTSALREQILAEVNLNKETALPPVWSIQRSIQPEELIVHFTEIGTKLYVSYLTQNDIDIRIFDFSNEVQETFNQTADELASGRTNLNHLYDIYELLGLKDLPTDYSNVSVIPDNSLYRIPLEVLPTKKPSSAFSFGSSHYLIEDFSFRYFTSLKEFENNRRSFTTSVQHDFSGFAISDFSGFEGSNLPSLPFATVENTNINLALTSLQNKRMYNGDEATKEVFKSQVGSSRLVHVATHSEVSEQDPLFSTIYLKNSNPLDTLESDQALYAYELFDTPLNSEFIMLNSCSSGSGSYIQGSGVMGISRALRYAGAKSLALNLWSVNDKVASEFATDFYSYLNEGITKSEAIRKAKLNQLKKANANPHFWGAYMLIGNPSPITDDPSENGFLLFSLLTFTAIFAGFSTYYKAA
ncbi:MAG: CHAT domain-containing protein [Gracilimonas sp.]